MQLVIGGAFQGKKDYVKNTFHLEKGEMQDGANASYEDIFSSPCLYHFHQWIRKGLEENWDRPEIPGGHRKDLYQDRSQKQSGDTGSLRNRDGDQKCLGSI